MLKERPAATMRPVPTANSSAPRVSITAVYRDTMKRYPATMALLAE